MTRRMYDAAYPPPSPPDWEVVAGYIGGDTPHVWTHADWASQPARWRLPIYVRSDPGAVDPGQDAAAALARLAELGAPRGSAVALDLETAVDGAYVRGFDHDIVAAGHITLAYGSLSTIFGNPKTSGGYWVAHYTGSAHLEAGSVATQWTAGNDYDSNLIEDSVPLWDTHPAPAPPPQEEDDMPNGELKDGPTGPTICSWPAGKAAAIGFLADNGFQGKPPAKLRVAPHHPGGWGPVVDVDVDSTKGKAVVHLPADCDGCSVARLDDGAVAVSWDAS